MGTELDNLSQLPPERRWRQQERPVAGVLVFIRREGVSEAGAGRDFLLIQRRQNPFAGKWALVGGKIEFGETLAEAAVREVAEETELQAEFVALRAVVNERLVPTRPQDRGGHFLLFVCEVSAPDGIPQEKNEGRVEWFSRAELDGLHERAQIIPSDFAMIQHFAGSKASVPYVESVMVTHAVEVGGTHLTYFDPAD